MVKFTATARTARCGIGGEDSILQSGARLAMVDARTRTAWYGRSIAPILTEGRGGGGGDYAAHTRLMTPKLSTIVLVGKSAVARGYQELKRIADIPPLLLLEERTWRIAHCIRAYISRPPSLIAAKRGGPFKRLRITPLHGLENFQHQGAGEAGWFVACAVLRDI